MMQIRISIMKGVTLCVGVLLMAGSAAPTQAESWFTFKSKGTSKVTDEDAGVDVPAPEPADSDDEPPKSGSTAPAAMPNYSSVEVDCPADAVECSRQRRCRGRGPNCCQRCRQDPYRCSCWKPLNPCYCDPRDLQVYSAQGFNVPVTVPLAPMVQSYNYGWGIPSSRLSHVGGYASWNPDRPFTQSGGRLPGGTYPTVYQPTDTTQLGYYYNYVPTWQRRW